MLRSLLFLATFTTALHAQVLETRPAADDIPKTPQVHVPVIVRDHKGDPVSDLTTTNFTVKVDGNAQPINNIAREPDAPITYGIVFDVSRAQRNNIEDETKAARALLTILRPQDKVFIVHFAKDIELLQPPTSDKPAIERALNEVGTPSAHFTISDPNDGGLDSEGRRIRAAGPVLYDAIFLSADEILSKETGRRVLIVFSDGIDQGSKESLGDAREDIERNAVFLYSVYARGLEDRKQNDPYNRNNQPNQRNGGNGGGNFPTGTGGYPGIGGYPGGGNNPNNNPNGNNPNSNPTGPDHGPSKRPNVDGRDVLAKLSNDTGARLFDLGRLSAIEGDFAAVADDMRNAYWLSFTPQGAAARHGYHQYDVLISGSDKGRKVTIQTTDGYYGG